MEINEKELYVNRTWKYLVPSLRAFEDLFVIKFNNLTKFAVGIHDTLLDGSDIAQGRNLYILCKKNDANYRVFYDYIKDKDYYVIDYCPDTDFENSDFRMIVIKIHKNHEDSYDKFLEGKYSQMYKREDISVLFSHPARKDLLKIISLDSRKEEDFIKEVNSEFNTKLSIKDFEEKFEELDLPPKMHQEVFNFKGSKDTFISKDFKNNFNFKTINNGKNRKTY